MFHFLFKIFYSLQKNRMDTKNAPNFVQFSQISAVLQKKCNGLFLDKQDQIFLIFTIPGEQQFRQLLANKWVNIALEVSWPTELLPLGQHPVPGVCLLCLLPSAVENLIRKCFLQGLNLVPVIVVSFFDTTSFIFGSMECPWCQRKRTKVER